jgi:glycosyltransferase involved in cell wall biosynthesis
VARPSLPISVLLPTRNSLAYLPRHLESMKEWLPLVQEVVVVDSESNDGTVEFLKKHLEAQSVRFFAHPPGLYQSWNFGITQCTAKYIYLSTIGDSITRTGLECLVDAAEALDCNVLISPPRIVDDQGREVIRHWPIFQLIKALRLSSPVTLDGPETLLFALISVHQAILGSSASNLYRADCLKHAPFPTDFGRGGDVAWGLRYAAETKLGIVPKVFSTFLLHPKLYAARDYSVKSGAEKRLIAGRDTMGRKAWRQYGGVILDETAFENLSNEMLIAWSEFSLAQRRIRKRQKSRRRFLSPGAWGEYWILAQKLNVLRAAQHRGWKWIGRSIRGSARSITPASLQ